MLEGIGGDVRFGLRAIRRSPGFTLAAVVVLALGIGANTTVFSALQMAILTPLPFPEADRLVLVDLTHRRTDEPTLRPTVWSYPKLQTLLEAEDRLVDPVAGYASRNVTLTEPGDPALVSVELVTPGYFAILGRNPVLGRGFGPEEGDADDPRFVAVLSHGAWRTRFGADPDAVGSSLVLNGQRHEVVGVAPPGFEGLTGTAVAWVPMASAAQTFSRFMITGTQAHWIHVVGHLAEDATLEGARAQVRSLGDAIAERYPLDDPSSIYGADVRALAAVRVNEAARSAVLLLSVAAGLVLLVACANLSGLLLARARRTARDGAVRLAVGASRWRLVRGSLVESGIIAALGGAAGVALALWGTRAMAAAWPDQFLRSGSGEMRVTDPAALGIDAGVLGYALLVTLATVLLFGAAPALRASRGDLVGSLRNTRAGTRRARRLLGLDSRSALVGAQVALALVLLIGVGLLGRSTQRLLDVDLGFHPEQLLTFQYTIPRTDAWAEDASAFHAMFLERLEALPGVEGATLGTPPLSGHWSITLVNDVPGRPAIPQGEDPPIGLHLVGDDYFELLGVPVLRGRALGPGDGTVTQPALVLSRTAAEQIFPGVDPVGRRLRIGISADDRDPYALVVGVVEDVRHNRPDEEVIPEAYYSSREFGGDRSVTVLVRTSGDPMDVLPAVRDQLSALNPELPISSVATGDDLVARAGGDRRIVLVLLSLFAALAVLLAATGTWGVVAYAVADRRRELGLRMALGSNAGAAVRTVLARSLWATVLGLAAGLGGAWATSRLLGTFLFETSTQDPVSYAGGAFLLLGVVFLASWLPARRAAQVDPADALRVE